MLPMLWSRILRGSGAASLGDCCPAFRDNVVVSNVGLQFPSNVAQRPRKAASSTTFPWKAKKPLSNAAVIPVSTTITSCDIPLKVLSSMEKIQLQNSRDSLSSLHHGRNDVYISSLFVGSIKRINFPSFSFAHVHRQDILDDNVYIRKGQ